jgi:hypothetical protein
MSKLAPYYRGLKDTITAKKASEETFLSIVYERFIYGKHNHYRRSNRT